mmetsp:Transcript_52621/g.152995  ORF Transcript_52621/g.152995 Transcript_52621/m.152995 type:complete len:241 (-) Transcript_52621:108-830(-)
MRLRHDFQCLSPVQGTLLVAKGVEGLLVGGLVPAQPLADPAHDSGALGLHVGDVAQFRRQRIVFMNAYDLPVQLPVVDHREDAQDLDLLHAAHGQRPGADLHGVQRVVVAADLELRVLVCWILPSLRKHAVVPEDRAMVVPQLTFLHILRDGIVGLLGVDLHLLLRHLGDLHNHIQEPFFQRAKRYVVPRRDVAPAAIQKSQPIVEGANLTVILDCYLLRELDLLDVCSSTAVGVLGDHF